MIRPTHTCFDDALEFLECLALVETPKAEILAYTVVHAICLTPDERNQRFAHAWVEHDQTEMVWQLGFEDETNGKIPFGVKREEFYTAFRPQKTTRYTAREALAENYRTTPENLASSTSRCICRGTRALKRTNEHGTSLLVSIGLLPDGVRVRRRL